MGERHDYVALEWVKGEIAETLKQARQALEDYVENPQDLAQLNFCLTYIHQVHGTLQMVEFFGAALLAEEMEKLAQALIDGSISNLNEALEVMMQAIIQLPLYLERIQSARRDLPMVILPLLNDLRAARDEKLLSETSLFAPALQPAGEQLDTGRLAQLESQGLSGLLRKLRQAQQLAMVGLLRNQQSEQNLVNMARVFTALEKISQGAPLAPLWQVSLGLIDGLANNSLELSASVRALMRQLDAQLRKLTRTGAEGLNQPPPADLLKNLLFYVAKAQPNSRRLTALHEKYQLEDAVPNELMLLEERAHLAGPDRSTIRSVINALSEEFTNIKDRLDLFVRSDRSNLEELSALQAPLKQIGDTLAVLGFAQPRKVILDQIDAIAGIVAQTVELNDGTLMDIAGALLYLEATLSGMAGKDDEEVTTEQAQVPTTDISKLHRVVFKEARTGLEQAKDHIIAFIATKWKHEHLQGVPALLTQVRGGLDMIPLKRAASLVNDCCRYVENELLAQQKVPSWQELDCLADAITSVEYYLERLFEEDETKNDSILDMAQESLEQLGYYSEPEDENTAAGQSRQQPEELVADAEPGGEQEQEQEPETAAEELAQQPDQQPEPAAEPAEPLQEEELDFDEILGADLDSDPDVYARLPEVELAQAAPQQEEAASATTEPGLDSILAGEAQSPVNPPAVLDTELSILPPGADEEELDEELQEIFIEEAGEVLETIEEYYPQWKQNADDQNSLTEVRRAFHTLKGSGRMVKALIVGELAWSIENLLNRVIEGTVTAGEQVFDVVERVIELTPELVQEFADKQQRQRTDVDLLANIAHALAKKQQVDELTRALQLLTQPEQDSQPEQIQEAPVPELEPELELESESESEQEQEQELVPEPEPEPEPQDLAETPEELPDELEMTSSVTQNLHDAGLEPALIDIFYNEAVGHLRALGEFNQQCQEYVPRQVTDGLQRSLHTLKGSAHMSGVEPIAMLVTPLERLVKEYRAHLLSINAAEARLLQQAEQLMWSGVRQLGTTPLQPLPGSDELVLEIQALLEDSLESIGTKKDSSAGNNPLMIIELMSEGMDLLLEMDEQLEQWRKDVTDIEVPVDLLEELSTLQSAAQMAEIPAMVELCDALQRAYLAMDNGQLVVVPEMLDELEQAHNGLISMLDEVAASLKVTAQPQLVETILQLPQKYGQPEPGPLTQEPELADEPEPEAVDELDLDLEQLLELDELQSEGTQQAADEEDISLDELLSGMVPDSQEQPGQQVQPLQNALAEDEAAAFDYTDLDEEMVEIFLEEAQELVESANSMLEGWLADEDGNLMTGLMRNLHTIKGGARMAEIGPVGDLAHELEYIYEGILEGRFSNSQPLAELLHRAHDELTGQIEILQQRGPLYSPLLLIEQLQQLRANGQIDGQSSQIAEQPEPEAEPAAEQMPDSDFADGFDDLSLLLGDPAPEPEPQQQAEPSAAAKVDFERDPELVEIFLEEGFELIESIATAMQNWLQDTNNLIEVTALQRYLHTLKGGARMAEISEIGDLSHELEFLYEDLGNSRLEADEPLIAILHECHDTLATMLEQLRDNQPIAASQDLIAQVRAFRSGQPVSAQPAEHPDEPVADSADQLDQDLIAYFARDASSQIKQLAAQIDALLNAQQEQRSDALASCMNLLTPLKSGAQLANQLVFARQCNQLEQELLKFEMGVGDAQVITQLLDNLQLMTARLEQTADDEAPQQNVRTQPEPPALSAFQQQLQEHEQEARQQAEEIIAQALPFVRKAQEQAERKASERGGQEQVRVAAQLLEQLVNLAGETSIFRARVEQQVSDFGYTLAEMDATLERIRDQLRRLDTETQAQIISRHQQEMGAEELEDFDPLEMDQYSHLQQLSRSLFETSSDLYDLKESLVSKARDTETLLLQQSRVNTELQEGLMRTRMVPFERTLPRLQRIVRQVSAELGKKVELQVSNAEGEMDRSVMERLVAPLEHLLRNAIGHGIEPAEVRRQHGKPETGVIRIELGREGADVVLSMSDDGAGINIDAVRQKAVELGMMVADSALSDHEIMQFILQSGFSTAERVTQVSGRGVGMDVVASEIKQIGGTVSIDSQPGAGTTFTFRIPFTVSINRALMVLAGEDLYAVPLNVIEGIVRVSPYELEALYAQAQESGQPATYEYAGQEYELRHIGELLSSGQQPRLEGQLLPLPVLLVRSNEHAMAVQVDTLAGSREIVVKSLGPQFAEVRGVSGATLLGDGRVVIILDLMALIRHLYANISNPQVVSDNVAAREQEQKRKLIMIVDDSVTVRKVTSRLLERNNMDVMTAKDGMDAVTQLHERKPDLMLLDIEMPRMDGFEVARQVRHDEELHDLPIIMITSRTGEKHRERAMAIGVNEYLGKPYQEAELLEKIRQLAL